MRIFNFILFFLFTYTVHSQSFSDLLLESGVVSFENNIKGTETIVFNLHEKGYVFRILTFDEIPSQTTRAQLEEIGVELFNYLPRGAYYAKITKALKGQTLKDHQVNGIHLISPEIKFHSDIKAQIIPDYAQTADGKWLLNISIFENENLPRLQNQLESLGVRIITNSAPFWVVECAPDRLTDLANVEYIYHIAPIGPSEEPENDIGRLNHRSNSLVQEFDFGLNYDGTGISIMMQDDGELGQHIDFKGRFDHSFCSGCSQNPSDDHGDHVAGTILGAGNIEPKGRGMAFGANLYVFNSDDTSYNAVPSLYANQGVVITSKSYSNGCNAGYTSLTAQLDEQVRSLPSLIHVFSAGNKGTNNCAYGAGSGWGNITGGHKMGKNVLTVGNLNGDDVINTSSSRGPATDGRIKPDICAVGTSVYSTIPDFDYGYKSGTSMACPGVSGTVAQLYHAYKDLNGGENPPSGLIKAAILNSAEDLGNPGPDFIYGYGRINARRAYSILENNNYIIDSLFQGDADNFFIDVPPGVNELRVMVYWTDYEGTVGASYALVNDLNMKIKDPLMTLYEPWVLDHTPVVSSLSSDAIRGVDSLNNMEQVTIENPIPGSYEIDIFGDIIPQGPQTYFIVYEMISDELVITHPNGGEGIGTVESCQIRWDATKGVDSFSLEYTMDNGNSWSQIGTANFDDRVFYWNVPNDTLSGQAKIRITRGIEIDESDSLFSIINSPVNLNLDWRCPDSVKLSWDIVQGASEYEVSMLGAKYMDSLTIVSDNWAVVGLNESVDTWFSVRSLGAENARSERAIAIHKLPGQEGCIWSNPFANFQSNCQKSAINECVTVTNESINIDAGSINSWYFPGGSPSFSSDLNPTVCYSSTGFKDAALVVQNLGGTDSIYISNFIEVIESDTLPYFESFENMVDLGGTISWDVFNESGNQFEVINGVSLTGNQCVWLQNFGEPISQIDELFSRPINLSGLGISPNDTMTLSFRYSYRKAEESNNEQLVVRVKKTCDATWQAKKILIGNNLSSAVSIGPWVPQTQDDWVTVHVSGISSSYWTAGFMFEFQFLSDGGNNLYIDDINIYQGQPSDEIVGTNDIEAVIGIPTIYPNPTDNETILEFSLLNDEQTSIFVTDISGRIVFENTVNGKSGKNLVFLGCEKMTPGKYNVAVKTHSSVSNINFIKL